MAGPLDKITTLSAGPTFNKFVLDNLSEGVISPDYHDPSLNPLYRDLLTHNGALDVDSVLARS